MTEDDTYLKLIRPSYIEMYHLVTVFIRTPECENFDEGQELSYDDFLKQHNWDPEEYVKLLQEKKYLPD